MLRLWSQVARPQLSCSCIACSSCITGVLARRTASATTRRRLKLVDAFTILLAPLFATAFVADASWKDRRRVEWDRKIAEVEGEVERLRRQESQILRSLSSGVTAQRKTTIHARSYSTDVRPRALVDDTDEEVDASQWWPTESDVKELDDANKAFVRDAQESPMPDPQMAEDTRDAVRRIERLVALKLALRMLLHVQIGASPRFQDIDPGYSYRPNDQAEDLNGLIDKLKTVRRSLRTLNSAEERPDVSTLQKMPRREQTVIDREIRHHAHDFKLGNLSVSRLVKRICNSIIRSPEPPSVKAYVPLMTTLSRARVDEMAYLVMSAMDEARLTLSNHSVFNIIWQYGKNRDANRFDLFLKSVVKARDATKYTESWECRIINEVEVPCPTSNDSRLLQILVYTALKCNQPHRAEAWVSQLRNSDGPARHTSHILRNFMKFCATNRDWQRGQAWLSAALDWSILPGPNVVRDLQRVVFAMLELCVACGKQIAYIYILQAAVHARVGIFAAEVDLKFSERSKGILAEWEKLHNSVSSDAERDSASARSKATAFCEEVIPKLKALGLAHTSPRFKWPTPASMDFQFREGSSEHFASAEDSASKWRELCEKQAAELETVKAELAELEWLRSRMARSEIDEIESQSAITTLSSASRRRRRHSSALLLDTSASSAPNSPAENSATSPLHNKPLLPSSAMAPTVPSEVSQKTRLASSDISQPNSHFEQMAASIFTQAADSRPRRDTNSSLEDLIRATASSDVHFDPHKSSESTSAQQRSRQTSTVESKQESSLCPHNQLPPDSIQSNSLLEVQPLAVSTSNLGKDTDHFHERDAHSPKAEPMNSPIDQLGGLVAKSPVIMLPRPLGEATDKSPTHSCIPPTAGTSDTPENAIEPQPTETPKQTNKGQWVSFLKMPRERKLSARATLRYIHLGKVESPDLVERPPERLVRYTDRKVPPHIVLRLGQLPSPKAVKWVNGEFKPRRWSTEKAEAYAAQTEVRPTYHRRG